MKSCSAITPIAEAREADQHQHQHPGRGFGDGTAKGNDTIAFDRQIDVGSQVGTQIDHAIIFYLLAEKISAVGDDFNKVGIRLRAIRQTRFGMRSTCRSIPMPISARWLAFSAKVIGSLEEFSRLHGIVSAESAKHDDLRRALKSGKDVEATTGR
jgi:hypothetical protein